MKSKAAQGQTIINPYLSAPTADTGAQVIMLGHNHLSRIGLNISCLHCTAAVMDCAMALKDLGVIPATFPRIGKFGGI